MLEIIQKLSDIAPRYGIGETKAGEVIIRQLEVSGITYLKESFKSSVPYFVKAELFADDIAIECLGSSLVSGKIENANHLISAFGNSGENHPFNISYSPITDEISVVDIYREPSVTISRKSVVQIVMAKEVWGEVIVEKQDFETANILVGNTQNPKSIVIAHYDNLFVGKGALDNAGAVVIMFEIIKNDPKIIENNLFVFSGNEEVSYDDYKTKSGYGFRKFEEKHFDILKNCWQIIVIDGIGVSDASFSQNGLDWVLQVKCLDEIRNKVFWLQNDQSEVLKYFHTKADTIENISEKYLQQAYLRLFDKITNTRFV